MALSGGAAMVLYYGIEASAVADHDDWHTHEHFPERLSVPGFVRASRWVAVAASPRYLVLYEVEAVAVLSGAPYLERLNNPTPWTTRMMPNFRGKDAEMPLVLLVTGYDAAALASAAAGVLPDREFERHGAAAPAVRGNYRMDLVQAAS